MPVPSSKWCLICARNILISIQSTLLFGPEIAVSLSALSRACPCRWGDVRRRCDRGGDCDERDEDADKCTDGGGDGAKRDDSNCTN